MWIKVHLMCGVKTNIVTSVEISDGYANDHGYFKPLVEAAAENGFTLKEVAADKAYLSGENLLTTLRHGAIPYVPFKSNSKAQTNYGPKSTLWTRMLEFLHGQPGRISNALSQAVKRGNHVSHDQVKVWSETAKQDANGADQ